MPPTNSKTVVASRPAPGSAAPPDPALTWTGVVGGAVGVVAVVVGVTGAVVAVVVVVDVAVVVTGGGTAVFDPEPPVFPCGGGGDVGPQDTKARMMAMTTATAAAAMPMSRPRDCPEGGGVGAAGGVP
jgi:hypothetical protein